MSLGVAVFASNVLILAAYHRGFRRVMLCTAAVATLTGATYFGYERYSTWRADRVAKELAAETEKGVETCIARLDALPGRDAFDKVTDEKACRAFPDFVAPQDGTGRIRVFVGGLPHGYRIDAKTHQLVPVRKVDRE